MDSNRPYCHQSSLERSIDCRSYWNTCLDSDHSLIRARICLRLNGRRKSALRRPIRIELEDEKAKCEFQKQLSAHLGSSVNETDPDAAWKEVRTAVETAVTSILLLFI
ncbi:unnamed protein product [Schistosoma rodhaini]|uniref:Uncharacterized protein n=1 Tax=Schistosoma rodhaini TaxID=6188 RepID=A0AA85G9Q4_9TREM|nr:unnamed protein product [Schistosoma rodhaini]